MNNTRRHHFTCATILLCLSVLSAHAISLEEFLLVYAPNTPKMKAMKLEYANSCMTYENYKKSFLPSIRFGVSPLNVNRSLRLLQNPVSGNYSYVNDYSNTSDADVTITQRISTLGGTLTASSSIGFLREFSYNRNSISTSPLYISYSQPLRGGHKEYVYTRNIRHLQHTLTRKQYAAALAEERQTIASLYMAACMAKMQYESAVRNAAVSDSLLSLTRIRFDNGNITEYDYQQIEVQQIDAQIAKSRLLETYRNAKKDLCTEIGIDDIEISPQDFMHYPEKMDVGEIEQLIQANNPQALNQALSLEEAKLERYKARMETRFGGNVSLTYGLNQYAETLAKAYKSPDRRQAVSVTFSIPVFQ